MGFLMSPGCNCCGGCSLCCGGGVFPSSIQMHLGRTIGFLADCQDYEATYDINFNSSAGSYPDCGSYNNQVLCTRDAPASGIPADAGCQLIGCFNDEIYSGYDFSLAVGICQGLGESCMLTARAKITDTANTANNSYMNWYYDLGDSCEYTQQTMQTGLSTYNGTLPCYFLYTGPSATSLKFTL